MEWRTLSTAHRIGAGVFALLMWTMAFLQLNDPDPALWVAMYCALAVVCTLSVFKGVLWHAAWLGLIVAFVWAASLFPSVYELFAYHEPSDLMTGMAPERPYVEEARESLGLLIGCLAMAHQLVAGRLREPER